MIALIVDENNVVVNTSVWAEGGRAPDGHRLILVSEDVYVGIGSVVLPDGTFTAPKNPSENQEVIE